MLGIRKNVVTEKPDSKIPAANIFELLTYTRSNVCVEDNEEFCIIEYRINKDGKRGFPMDAHSIRNSAIVSAMLNNPIKYQEVKLNISVQTIKTFIKLFTSNNSTIPLAILLNYFVFTQSPIQLIKYIHFNYPKGFVKLSFDRKEKAGLELDKRVENMQDVLQISFKDCLNLLEINEKCYKKSYDQTLDEYDFGEERV